MREIKFRAWDKVVGKMIVFEKGIFNRRPYTETSTFPQYESCKKYHELEIMQFTGLLDRDGREIFEGDIVYWKHLNQKAVVYYNEDEVHYYAKPLPTDEDKTESYLDSVTMEVIGNIYENPELL